MNKKKYEISQSIIFLFLLIFFQINKTHANIPVQCYDFVEQYKNLEFSRLSTQTPTDTFTDFGFSFNYNPKDDALLYSTEFTSTIRRINNYPVISNFTTRKSYELFKKGDIIIAINGSDTSKMKDQDIFDNFFFPNSDLEYELTLLRDNEEIKIKIKPHKYKLPYYGINLGIESIKEIDVINSSVTFSAYLDSTLYYYGSAYPQIIDLAKKTIVALKDDGTYGAVSCIGLDADYTKKNRIPNPIEIISFDKLIEQNKNLTEEYVDIQASKDGEEMIVEFAGNISGTWEVKNKFNLSSFPFDKQKIKISIFGESIDESILDYEDASYRFLDYSKKNISIPGWDVKEIKLNTSNSTLREVIFSQLDYEIQIERQYFYYIFKIILPIILILSICWSSVWLNRKEVESKLTITIVCLLSLIAYNFVIDNEIPKLNYLTIMDWIILLSYIYAAIPNILAIITYQFGLNTKYKKFNFTIDNYSKKFGIGSYILLVLLIIIINVSNVPDNTIDSLSWAMVK